MSNLSYHPGISWSDWGRLHKKKLGQPLPLPVVIRVTFQIHVRVISTTTLAHLVIYTNYKKTLQCIYHDVIQGNVYVDNWCHSMTQTHFLYLVLIHTDMLIISYICIPMPVHIIWCLIIPTVGSSMLLVLKQDLEAKNGGKVETAVIWWLEEQRCYLCGHRFEGLIHGSRILLSIQNNLHFTVM